MNYLYCRWKMGPCFYCGRQTYRTTINPTPPWKYTRDHLIPSRLRTKLYNNLPHYLTTVVCCNKCNKDKGNLSAQEFITKFFNWKSHIGRRQIASVYRWNKQGYNPHTGSGD